MKGEKQEVGIVQAASRNNSCWKLSAHLFACVTFDLHLSYSFVPSEQVF
jgi:hypothetical protein